MMNSRIWAAAAIGFVAGFLTKQLYKRWRLKQLQKEVNEWQRRQQERER